MPALRLLAIVLFVIAVVLRSELLGGVAALLGVATVLAGVWTARLQRALRIEREVPALLDWGSQAEVVLTITNGSLLPLPWLQIEESIPLLLRTGTAPHLVLGLAAGGQRTVRYAIQGAQRGWYHLGPLRITLGDVLGLAVEQARVAPTAITVLPRILPVTDLGLPAALPFGPLAARHRQGEDPARPAGVRAYQASDGVRRIDWKATAHRGELMVRRADPAISPETTFALSLGKGEYPARVLQNAVERAITAVASLAVALLQRKLPVGLITNGYDPKHATNRLVLPLGKGDGQRNLLLEVLGRLEPGREASIWAVLKLQPLPWGGTLVIVLADLTAAEIPLVLQMVRRGQQVALLLLEGTPSGVALAQRYGLALFSVDGRGIPRR